MAGGWINYHHLYYFRTIANEGGIAKASRKLRLGQPTLSTQLKQFEDTLGHQLFHREKRKLILTEAGRVTLEYANEIFRLGTELLETLDDHQTQGRLELQVGALDTVPKHLLLKLIQQAQATNGCKINLVEGVIGDLLEALREHRLDLVLSDSAPHAVNGTKIRSRNIAKMPVVIAGSQKYAHLNKGFPHSLQGQPLALPATRGRLRDEVESYLKSEGVSVDVVAEVQDTSLLKLLATHDMALIPAASSAIEELIENESLVRIGVIEGVTEELWVTTAERKIQNPAAAMLFKSFRL